MRIRTQLIASALLAGLVAMLIAVGLLYVARQAKGSLDEQEDAEQVARHVANMLSLTNEVTLYGGERAVMQWRSRHVQLLAAVERALRRRDPPSPQLMELRRNVSNLPSLFEKLVLIAEEPAAPLAQRRRDLLLERLLAETQEVVESRHRWSVAIGEARRRDQRRYTSMVLVAPCALLLLLMSLGLLIGRRVLKPLAHLQATVTAIRNGNLGVHCDTGVPDELGDAARAIDSMTSTLQRQGEALAASNELLSREVAARRDSEERLRLVTDNLPALVSYIDRDKRFRFANRAYRDWIGVDPTSLIGRSLSEVYGQTVYAGIRRHIETALAGDAVTYEREFSAADGPRHVQVALVPQRDTEGSVQGLVTTIHDITERKQAQERLNTLNSELELRVQSRTSALSAAVKEKEVLLQEVHHRVKNNLQLISSLLQLQASYVVNDDTRKVFEECKARIESMSLVHEKLYQTKDFARIDFGDYIRDLVSGLVGSYAGFAPGVSVEVQAASVPLDVHRAIPAGLIVNELVSNSFKHGFPDGRSGRILVHLSDGGGSAIQLGVRDNGVGWPADFDPARCSSLGLRLVHILARQLPGRLHLENAGGISCTLVLGAEPR